MKKIVCFCLCAFIFTAIKGQHDTQINSYMFNQVLVNPAFAGNHERIEATVLQRSQFIGIKGAPVVWDLSLSTPFKLLETRHGAAFTLNNDKIGAFNKIGFALDYAYWHDLPNAKLGVGLSLGGISYQLSPTWNDIVDDAIPTRSEASSSAFDMSLGAFYQHRDFSIGLACTHINQPNVLMGESGNQTLTVKRAFYLNGDYHWNTPVENLEVVPFAMFMMVNITLPQLGFGGNAVYLKKYWGGLSYRIGDAIGVSGGMLFKSLRLGFVYEYSLSKLIGFNMGTTEIFISYFFDINLNKKAKKYKSIRFL